MNKKTTKEKCVCPAVTAGGVKLVSYTLKATIPTGDYENIQPEITVTAPNVEVAHKYCLDFIGKIRREYSINVEKVQVNLVPPPQPENIIVGNSELNNATSTTGTSTPGAYGKAKQAIDSCLTAEALNLIAEQIHKSVKLNDQEKKALLMMATVKINEFNGSGN